MLTSALAFENTRVIITFIIFIILRLTQFSPHDQNLFGQFNLLLYSFVYSELPAACPGCTAVGPPLQYEPAWLYLFVLITTEWLLIVIYCIQQCSDFRSIFILMTIWDWRHRHNMGFVGLFFLLLFLCFVAYFFGGMLILKMRGATGLEIIPNYMLILNYEQHV